MTVHRSCAYTGLPVCSCPEGCESPVRSSTARKVTPVTCFVAAPDPAGWPKPSSLSSSSLSSSSLSSSSVPSSAASSPCSSFSSSPSCSPFASFSSSSSSSFSPQPALSALASSFSPSRPLLGEPVQGCATPAPPAEGSQGVAGVVRPPLRPGEQVAFSLAEIGQMVESQRQQVISNLRKRVAQREYCIYCERNCIETNSSSSFCPQCQASTLNRGSSSPSSPSSLSSSASSSASSSSSASASALSSARLLPDGHDPNAVLLLPSLSASRGERGFSSFLPGPRNEEDARAYDEELAARGKVFFAACGAEPLRTGEEGEDADERFVLSCRQRSCRRDPRDFKDLLVCFRCRQSHHASCCDPPLNFELVTRYPWHCADCKRCECCQLNTNEEQMLICDACDRAYHMDCMEPPVEEVPDGTWFCADCGRCACCDRRLSDEKILDPHSCVGSMRRLCFDCKERHRRGKRSRLSRLGSSQGDAGTHSAKRTSLCDVCVKSLCACEGKPPKMRVACDLCKQVVHADCARLPQEDTPDKQTYCLTCYQLSLDFH
ncbi:PHD-finger domain-containing protein [Toxoplasma gondii CAST]|uniref:PHD-finger domain-containing protein n=3 Tax=Toxoplasma gondii TaxID=5811 RepID=A0A425HVL1_TOXGO|nr:PHD-finger domain-containing protein [Toxoplasma gondii CAST]